VLALLVPLLLSPGVKGFFEDPRYLLGLPLAAIGALGILVALSPVELRWPQPATQPAHMAPGAEGHPGPAAYVTVGAILAVVTMIEVGVYYTSIVRGALITVLLLLSAMKFVLVVLWFMHLQFDSKVFSVLFAGVLLLVVSLFVVVLTTLGASLV
jgi:cytochrome c oxidase subunit 4